MFFGFLHDSREAAFREALFFIGAGFGLGATLMLMVSNSWFATSFGILVSSLFIIVGLLFLKIDVPYKMASKNQEREVSRKQVAKNSNILLHFLIIGFAFIGGAVFLYSLKDYLVFHFSIPLEFYWGWVFLGSLISCAVNMIIIKSNPHLLGKLFSPTNVIISAFIAGLVNLFFQLDIGNPMPNIWLYLPLMLIGGYAVGYVMIYWTNIWNLISFPENRGLANAIGTICLMFSFGVGVSFTVIFEFKFLLLSVLATVCFLVSFLITGLKRDVLVHVPTMVPRDAEGYLPVRVERTILIQHFSDPKVRETLNRLTAIFIPRKKGKPPRGEFSALILYLLDNTGHFGGKVREKRILAEAISIIVGEILKLDLNQDAVRKNFENHLKKLQKMHLVYHLEGKYLEINPDWQNILNFL